MCLLDLPVRFRGSLGPDRVFGNGALYHPSVYAAVAGIFLPIPFWLLGRHYKRSIWRKVDSVVLFNSLLGIPPANGVNYASFLIVGFVFRKSAPFLALRRKLIGLL